MALSLSNILIFLLQCYFILMNVTVERYYCHSELTKDDTRFLVPETVAFCRQYNPLFLGRPKWMKTATCVSAYGFCPFYTLIAIAAITNAWAKLRIPIVLFIGAKLYAIMFYHLMEFTSRTPPQHLGPYFAVEGPYLVSIALVLFKTLIHESNPTTEKDKDA
jgi:hypothetical protein